MVCTQYHWLGAQRATTCCRTQLLFWPELNCVKLRGTRITAGLREWTNRVSADLMCFFVAQAHIMQRRPE